MKLHEKCITRRETESVNNEYPLDCCMGTGVFVSLVMF